jgi:hypothetical protein
MAWGKYAGYEWTPVKHKSAGRICFPGQAAVSSGSMALSRPDLRRDGFHDTTKSLLGPSMPLFDSCFKFFRKKIIALSKRSISTGWKNKTCGKEKRCLADRCN